MPHEELPFWHFNVPIPERTVECPEFLLDISEKDRRIIGTWDSDFEPQSWEDVKHLVQTNKIDQFQRCPSELRRYRNFTHSVKKDWGSVLEFILQNRIHWTDGTPQGLPFTCPSDVKILFNDWPYGIDPRITHLVVWTKFELSEDGTSITGDLHPEMRKQISDFVDKIFTSRVRKDKVVWFKNWKSLKSVHAIEHFHVMLMDADPSFIDEVTGGDVPLCAKAAT